MVRYGIYLILIALVAGCAGSPAPIYDRSSNPYRRAAPTESRIARPSSYVVRRGDTLYAIAWRYGLDFKTLARWNGIAAPYTIFPDQRITLTEPRNLPPVQKPVAATPAPKKPPVVAAKPTPITTSSQSQTRPSTQTKPAPSKPTPKPPVTIAAAPSGKWRWPAEGKVLRGFSQTGGKGLDIAGEEGQGVVAAADGEVVYSGTGLIGYGELIIIKHDAQYLSAYGHNRVRLVAEGDKVTAGQQIAEMGKADGQQALLHFEVRDNGKPVDPARFLP